MPLRAALRRAVTPALALTLVALPALAQDAAEAEAPAPSPDTVVATVNGTEITLAEIILMQDQLPDRFKSIPDARLMPALIDQAVNQALMAEKGREIGADESPMARARAAVDARDWLAQAGMREVIEDATSEEALRAEYEARYAEAEPEREVRASHILVESEAEAAAIKAEIEGGADFAEMAAEHGSDGTASRGGDLGWFDRGMMVAPFAEAAFAAEEGALVGPVQTQFGWHVILVTGAREKAVPSFEEVRADLARSVAQAAADAAVEAARAEASVEIAEDLPAPETIRRLDLLLGE